MTDSILNCLRTYVCILLLLTGATALHGEEVAMPQQVFFFQPVATAWGQTPVWINPAALGWGHRGEMLMFTHRSGHFIRDWGLSTTYRNFGFAYRSVPFDDLKDVSEYVFGVGAGRQFSYGLSYRYFKSGPGYLNKRHLWTLAVSSRGSDNMAFGARIENLNRGRIDGKRSDIRFVYGIAMRSLEDKLTLSFDVDMTAKESFKQADFRTGIEARPVPGLYLFADFDNHSQFNLGFRLNIGSAYAGHYHSFDRDAKSRYGTSFIGKIKGRQASPIKFPMKTLMIPLDGSLPENPPIPMLRQRPMKFYDYISGIYQAGRDEEIDRIFLNIGSLQCGLGKTEELAEALQYFRAQGKTVIAYLGEANNLGYLLASEADTIIIPPVSELPLVGLRMELTSYKGLMDKLGIEAEIERVDEYKTAPEMFILDKPSEESRAQANRLLDRLYDRMIGTIAVNRNLSLDSVISLIDAAPLISVEAVRCGLVDDRLYYDEAFEKYIMRPEVKITRTVSMYSYVMTEEVTDDWGVRPRLALLIADGDITEGASGGTIGEYNMLDAVRRVKNDGGVKGVCLRINSPGGKALPADLIWHEIEELAEKKPVIISMGNNAASGGYYIATIPAPILVNGNSLTGSIGVYAGKINLAKLHDKLGVYTETLTRGKNAAMYSMSQGFTEDQRNELRNHLRKFYNHFLDKVAAARSLSTDSVNALGRGQVWTGTEAVNNGLADDIGGLQDAMDRLAAACGLGYGDYDLVTYPTKYYLIRDPLAFDDIVKSLSRFIFGTQKAVQAFDINETSTIFYRMPYNVRIQ